MVTTNPVNKSILVESLINRVWDISGKTDKIGGPGKLEPVGEPAKRGRIQIDRHPDIRVRVVVLNGRKQHEKHNEDPIENFHPEDHNVKLSLNLKKFRNIPLC